MLLWRWCAGVFFQPMHNRSLMIIRNIFGRKLPPPPSIYCRFRKFVMDFRRQFICARCAYHNEWYIVCAIVIFTQVEMGDVLQAKLNQNEFSNNWLDTKTINQMLSRSSLCCLHGKENEQRNIKKCSKKTRNRCMYEKWATNMQENETSRVRQSNLFVLCRNRKSKNTHCRRNALAMFCVVVKQPQRENKIPA